MAHYALLDQNNIVVQVITGKNEDELLDGQPVDWEVFYSQETGFVCKRTSYNTYAGSHKDQDKPAFRKNYAGIGYVYDVQRDAFITPKPYLSWLLDEDTCVWYAPVAKPDDYKTGRVYNWDEQNQQWVAVP